MSHYGLLGTHPLIEATEDVRGAALYGQGDEKLGKIDDVIFDHSSGNVMYVVVDTGGWLSTKKFIVPADRLRRWNRLKGDQLAHGRVLVIYKPVPVRESGVINSPRRHSNAHHSSTAHKSSKGTTQAAGKSSKSTTHTASTAHSKKAGSSAKKSTATAANQTTSSSSEPW